jgi:tagatose 1,6-diphosphate aldolase
LDKYTMSVTTLGKYRALQRASLPENVFTILAIDHQDALRQVLNPKAPQTLMPAELSAFKLEVVEALQDHASGVLLDPVLGAAQAIEAGLLHRSGLLLELEKADYNMQAAPLRAEVDAFWNVGKIKRMGGDGVKLFLYYNPDDLDLSAAQDALLWQVVADCRRHDIPLYAEPIIYPPAERRDDFGEAVIKSAQRMVQLGVDILKLEFPIDIWRYPDPADWLAACQRLRDAIPIPWVLLSGGVDFEIFLQLVEIACQGGASGFIAGRAVWGDACKIADPQARYEWLHAEGIERMQRLTDVTLRYALPWTHDLSLDPITPDWFRHYP